MAVCAPLARNHTYIIHPIPLSLPPVYPPGLCSYIDAPRRRNNTSLNPRLLEPSFHTMERSNQSTTHKPMNQQIQHPSLFLSLWFDRLIYQPIHCIRVPYPVLCCKSAQPNTILYPPQSAYGKRPPLLPISFRKPGVRGINMHKSHFQLDFSYFFPWAPPAPPIPPLLKTPPCLNQMEEGPNAVREVIGVMMWWVS